MKTIDFHLDFISPYAWLAFNQLPIALEGLNYSLRYKPVLLGALLRHHGQLGPAEIPAKRDWTYRHAAFVAQSLGVSLQMPTVHPFNPLPLLRLALACAPAGAPDAPGRFVCERLFRHVWCSGGADAVEPDRLALLLRELKPRLPVQDEAVKAQLKTNTDAAIALAVFGVPTFVVDGSIFWGLDALPMLRAHLQTADLASAG